NAVLAKPKKSVDNASSQRYENELMSLSLRIKDEFKSYNKDGIELFKGTIETKIEIKTDDKKNGYKFVKLGLSFNEAESTVYYFSDLIKGKTDRCIKKDTFTKCIPVVIAPGLVLTFSF